MVVAPLASFPGMMFGGCTDVGVPAGEGQRFGILGVEDGNLLYTPDGANECGIPLPAVVIPTGLVVAGTALALSPKVTDR